jgi:hypothetical protein
MRTRHNIAGIDLFTSVLFLVRQSMLFWTTYTRKNANDVDRDSLRKELLLRAGSVSRPLRAQNSNLIRALGWLQSSPVTFWDATDYTPAENRTSARPVHGLLRHPGSVGTVRKGRSISGRRKNSTWWREQTELLQWRVAYREVGGGGGLGGFNPPKFRSFDKAEPNSQFRGKYIRNNSITIQVSLICKLSGTPN